MARLGLKVVLACSLGLSAPAMAGIVQHPIKYSVENGVKVYRNQLSAAQQKAVDARLNALVRAEQQQRYNAEMIRLAELRIQNQNAAYERGFKEGIAQAQLQNRTQPHHHNNGHLRRRRGRYIAYSGNTYRGYGSLRTNLKRRRYAY